MQSRLGKPPNGALSCHAPTTRAADRRTCLPPIIESMPIDERPRLPFRVPEPPSLDAIISVADRALRSIFAPARASRPLPATAGQMPELSDTERRESGALMRVNHTGEVA